MEGKAHVLDEALGFLFLGEIPQVELVIPGIVVFHQGMEQVVIKVFRAGTLQAGLELLLRGLLRRRHGGVDLGGQGIAFPGIAFHQRLAGGVFRSQVDIGGIKIGEPGFQEQVHHLLHLFHINAQALPGQTHQSEAQLGSILSEVIHLFHLRGESFCSFFMICLLYNKNKADKRQSGKEEFLTASSSHSVRPSLTLFGYV